MKSAISLFAMFAAFAVPALASVTVSSPANNSTVTSPVHYAATASSTCAQGVASMGIYVNGQRVVVQNGASLNYNLALNSGSYNTVVQEWDRCGGSTTAPVHITVSGTQAGTTAVVVSAPSNNSTVTSPVTFSATATTAVCSTGIAAMGVYVDNTLAYKVNGAALKSSIPISTGLHQTVVQAWDTCGGAIKTPVTITVQAASTTAVHLTASPASINAGQSSVLSATASNATKLTITGSDGTSYNLPVGGGSVTVTPVATTTYTAMATGTSGQVTSVATVTVAASGTAVTVSSPTNNSTVTSPVNFSASANTATCAKGIAAMGIYVDNTLAYTVNGSALQTSLPISTGLHHTVVQAWDQCGGAIKTAVTITVQSSGTQTGNAVLMHKNDLAGDGANLNESTLTPANVNASTFGRRFALPVDGQLYAQPLYVPGMMINGTAHNTVFAATQNDSVYAFDSDSGAQLWKVSLGTAVANNDPEGVQPVLGILSTPVIDRNSNTLYVTAVTSGRVLKLHALDITSGAEKLGGPVTVTASVPGTGSGSSNGMVPLSSGCYQRTALTLASNRLYLGFGHCNHGWVLAYDATTLAQTQALNTSPDGVGATLWMGGAGPVVDASGNLYVITADDIGSSAPSATSHPDAVLKLSPTLQVLDSFTPSNERYLESNDADVGSGAPIVLPDNGSAHPHEVVGGGKDGRIFLVDRDAMGGYHPDPNGQNANIETIQTGTQQFDNIWGAPAFWNNNVFYHTEKDVLRAYSWNGGLLSSHSVGNANAVYLNHGASPSISANGNSNAIVWDVDDTGYPSSGGSGGTPAVLHAYNAANLSQELYNSSQSNGRDTAGHACKFSVPTVSDGKVFVPTCTELDIYGLLP